MPAATVSSNAATPPIKGGPAIFWPPRHEEPGGRDRLLNPFQPPQPTARRLKPTKTEKAYWNFLKTHCDLSDYCFADRNTGEPIQRTNAAIERDLNASPSEYWAKLPKLTLYQVVWFLRGHTTDLYIRPLRSNKGRPRLRLRIDGDAHHGETDVRPMVQFFNHKYFDGKLYDETSKRGHSGYLDVELTSFEIKGKTLYTSKRRMNAFANNIEAAMIFIAKREGFQASIELCGRYSTPLTMEDGTRRMRDGCRGQLVKLPRCPNEGDVERLIASRFSEGILHTIIRDAGDIDIRAAAPKVAEPSQVQAATPAEPAKLLPKRKNKVCGGKIKDTGDKHKNRVRCMRQAMRQLYGPSHRWVVCTQDEINRAVELANEMYEAAGLAGHNRDRERDTTFARIGRWLCRQNENGAGGDDPFWFGPDDIARAEDIIRSKLSRKQLDELNRLNVGVMGGNELTYYCLALALCTIAKNTHTSTGGQGDCPTTAISGMLNYFRIRMSGGGVRVINDVLEKCGMIACIDRTRYAGRCRRYAHSAKAFDLPFLAHLKPAELDYKAAEAQAERYRVEGRGGQHSIASRQDLAASRNWEVEDSIENTITNDSTAIEAPAGSNSAPKAENGSELNKMRENTL